MNLSFIFRYIKYDVRKRHVYKNIFGFDISNESYSDIKNEFISSLFLVFCFRYSPEGEDIKY